ncbi:MAG: hydrogenase formation protein HypD [Nitrososphaerota archaeon]
MQPELRTVQDIFRSNRELASSLIGIIKKYAEKIMKKQFENNSLIKIMHFCGTHEWAITHYGLRSLLPRCIELVAGPGCPVCVVPSNYIDMSIKLALEGYTIYTYGDALRLPSSRPKTPARSLYEAKSLGADVKVVYSFFDAIKDAKTHKKESIFLGIGFETILPIYGFFFYKGEVPTNLKFMSLVRLTPPAMKFTVKLYKERGLLPIMGVIAPGHVSAVIGGYEWRFLPENFGLPTVVTGFEPIDILMAIATILKMIDNQKPRLEIEYKRLVKPNGNSYVKKMVNEVFQPTYAAWRGIGMIARSGLMFREDFRKIYDAFEYFGIPDASPSEYVMTHAHFGEPGKYDLPPNCRCGEVVLGISKPTDCPLFMKSCTPETPWGPCMVSIEGTCNVWAKHGDIKNSLINKGE